MLHLLLSLSLSDAECQRRAYETDVDIEFVGTVFDGCSSADRGGALYIWHEAAIASVSLCSFINCSSGQDGGGLCFRLGSAFVVRSLFHKVHARGFAASLTVRTYVMTEAHWTELTLVGGSCTYNMFEYADVAGVGVNATLDRSNATENEASVWGSAGLFLGWNYVNVEFHILDSNVGPGCLCLELINAAYLRCLAVRSNQCIGESQFDGLFVIKSGQATISDSLIINNTVSYFVAGSGFTFENCLFDSFDLPARESFAMLSCELINTDVLTAPGCVLPTPSPPASNTPSLAPSAPFGSSSPYPSTETITLTDDFALTGQYSPTTQEAQATQFPSTGPSNAANRMTRSDQFGATASCINDAIRRQRFQDIAAGRVRQPP
jgi:hypothetical protein